MTIAYDSTRGVAVQYGTRTTNGKYGAGDASEKGIVKQAMWDFVYSDLPGSQANASKLQFQIPANSTIVSAKLYIDAAFTSTSTTTDLTVGLNRATDGTTAISATGLVTAAEATQTAIGTAGNVVTGAGALIGKLSDATYDGVVVVAASAADLLTGAARLVVEYVYNS